MKITDAAVFPYPGGDSTVRRMALEAKSLGFDSLVAVGSPAGTCEGVEILAGIVIQEASMKDVIARVKRARDAGAVISVAARDNGFNRAVLTLKGVHILRGVHAADKKAFDHVAAKMAADSRVAVDLDLAPLVYGRGPARQRVLQRYRDLLVLERRFEFPLTLSSNAKSVLDLRAVREITGLCSLMGMDVADVELALGGIGRVMTPPEPAVKVIP